MPLAFAPTRLLPEPDVMDRKKRIETLLASFEERILILDGAMGTMIQGFGLGEDEDSLLKRGRDR